MKAAAFFFLAGCCFFGFLIYRQTIRFTETVDIHLGYTYVTMDYLRFTCLAALLLLNFFTLGGVLGTGFRSRFFLVLLLLSALLDAALAWYIVTLLNS